MSRASYYRALSGTADTSTTNPGQAPASQPSADGATATTNPGTAPASDQTHADCATATTNPGQAPASDQPPADGVTATTNPGQAPASDQPFAYGATSTTNLGTALAGSLELPNGTAKGALRALSEAEKNAILDILHSERFIDRAPAEVFYTLADEKTYLGSISTFYRVLNAHQEVKERRAQRRHPVYTKPELMATGPNQVWSWDITKLLGPAKWTYYYLYVLLDIFSRYVVAWLLANKESADYAEQLIESAYDTQGIKPGQLSIHSDRGAVMQAKPVVSLHAKLGIVKSNSRPHVSNDNPFSESQFKTVKYSPGFPSRFEGGFEEASDFCTGFIPWYNKEHHHSGIAFLTPEQVHYGLADQILARRHQTLLGAYAAHPERFINGRPKTKLLDRAVYINPPQPTAADSPQTTLN